MKCLTCQTNFAKYDKWIFGTPGKPTFHYRGYCANCKKYVYLERTKELFDILKGREWKKSKHYIKIEQGTIMMKF